MNLQTIINTLELTPLTNPADFESIQVEKGYTSDLLSCVMAGAPHGSVWVTLQAHGNIVAVAALLELSAIIITEGAMPDPATITKTNEEGIILLSTPQPSYWTVGKLWELGIQEN